MKQRPPPSMQWRMTLVVASLFLAMIVAFGWVSLANVRQGYELTGDYQLALTSRIASDLDDRLQTSLDTLDATSRAISPGILGDAAAARRWLDGLVILKATQFDKGVFLFDRHGDLVASSSALPDIADSADFRRWIAVTLKLDEPLIGLPCRRAGPQERIGSGLLLPMVVPIHGTDGAVAGVLAGLADVQRPSLLGSVQSVKLGNTGYLFVTSWDGNVLVHSGQGFAMRQDRPVLPPDVLAAAKRGFRGPVETVDGSGEPVLATFVKMEATGWVLGASNPTREAFAQLHEQRHAVVLFLLLGTLATALATWLLMRFFVTPMKRFAKCIGAVDVTSGVLDPLPVPRESREIARIGRSFNELIARVNQEREQTHIAASVFRNVRDGIMVTDPKSRIISCNQAFEDITGYSADEVRGRSPSILKSGRHDGEFYRQMWQSLNEAGSWRSEVWNRRKNGEVYPVMLNISAARGDDGSVAYYVGILSDISELMSHRQRLEVMATTDALTGLPNRALLTDRLQQAMAHARRHGHVLGVAFVDLDGFKPINDQEGHHVGDRLLIEVAQRFGRVMRQGDTAARLGGDEFVILLNDVGGDGAALGALERILDAISAPCLVDGRKLAVSASIGITFYPADDADPDTLLRHADHAMYQAKNLGGARIHIFGSGYGRQFKSRQLRIEEVRKGIRDGQLVLHYQRKVARRRG